MLKQKSFELRGDSIPFKGYVRSLVFYTKFSHMLKQKPFELCNGFEPFQGVCKELGIIY